MKVQCDVCESRLALVLCCADEAALCEECDAAVHAANVLANKHQRVLIVQDVAEQAIERPTCDICQEKSAFFFCMEDRAVLCRDCDLAIHLPNTLSAHHRRFLLTNTRVALEPLADRPPDAEGQPASPAPLLPQRLSARPRASPLLTPGTIPTAVEGMEAGLVRAGKEPGKSLPKTETASASASKGGLGAHGAGFGNGFGFGSSVGSGSGRSRTGGDGAEGSGKGNKSGSGSGQSGSGKRAAVECASLEQPQCDPKSAIRTTQAMRPHALGLGGGLGGQAPPEGIGSWTGSGSWGGGGALGAGLGSPPSASAGGALGAHTLAFARASVASGAAGPSRRSDNPFNVESVTSWRADELLNIPDLADGYTLADIGSSKAEAANLGDFDWTADLSLFDEQVYAETLHEVPQMSAGDGLGLFQGSGDWGAAAPFTPSLDALGTPGVAPGASGSSLQGGNGSRLSSLPRARGGSGAGAVAVPDLDDSFLVPDVSAGSSKRRRA